MRAHGAFLTPGMTAAPWRALRVRYLDVAESSDVLVRSADTVACSAGEAES